MVLVEDSYMDMSEALRMKLQHIGGQKIVLSLLLEILGM